MPSASYHDGPGRLPGQAASLSRPLRFLSLCDWQPTGMGRHEDKEAKREKKEKSHHKEKVENKEKAEHREHKGRDQDRTRDKERSKDKHRSSKEEGNKDIKQPDFSKSAVKPDLQPRPDKAAQLAAEPVSKDPPEGRRAHKRDRDEPDTNHTKTETGEGREETHKTKQARTLEPNDLPLPPAPPRPAAETQTWKVEDSGNESTMSIDETNR